MEVLQRTANRGSISTDTGYNIGNSCKFEPDNTEYMRRSNGTDGNQRVFTQSMWIKRTELGYSYATPWCVGNVCLRFDSNDRLEVWCYTYDGTGAGTSNTDSYRIVTPNRFRDTSAWYHLVFALDTTQGTESNRLKVYVNNERVYHDGSSDIYDQTITQNSYTRCNGTGNSSENWNQIGWFYTGNYVFAGYIAEVNFVDGLQLSPTDVAEYDEDSGIWKPKQYTGAYGTNGYYLKFDDSSDLGADSSGSSHDMNSIGNITAADQATDTPTNNFATSNFLISQGGFFVTTEGGTKCVLGTAGPGNNVGGVSALSTIAVSKGKWYMEMKNDLANDSVDSYARFGFVDVGDLADGGIDGQMIAKAGNAGGAYFGGTGGGRYHYNNTAQGNSTTWIRQVMGMALDLDNKKVYFHIDGTYTNSGDPANGTDNGGQYDMDTGGDGIYVDKTWVLGASAYNLGIFLMNWGGYTVMPISSPASDANGYGTFEYAPPTGYYALCTKNLAEFG